jgi:hypothetical protein
MLLASDWTLFLDLEPSFQHRRIDSHQSKSHQTSSAGAFRHSQVFLIGDLTNSDEFWNRPRTGAAIPASKAQY